ncbi:MAG: M61 family metallopeptidase [Novosphingobium sp.]|nr:M61 family metallopeptidase [Novosphingobium sp.]
MTSRITLIAALATALTSLPALPAKAQTAAAPDTALAATPIPPAADTPWPGGMMTLAVDASDNERGIYRVTQTIPVPPGMRRLTLLFPQWLPGNHAPRGPIAELAGLEFSAGGQPLRWERDRVDVNAFHIELPGNGAPVVARFVHTSPLKSSEGRITMTSEMLNLQWEKMSLYPAGHNVSRIGVTPTVILPGGWNVASALDGRTRKGDTVTWASTDYGTLVDSPVFAGLFFRQWPLGTSAELSAFADAPALLSLRAGDVAALSKLVNEATTTFGPAPFDRYEYLVALSSRIGGIGLEHLRSTEIQLEQRTFLDWDAMGWDRNVIPHELVHAWNGKYRRPARMATPDYRTPMESDLLWVYEGQSHFWGWVLGARSGVQSKDIVLGMIAQAAGQFAVATPGRSWRSVGDTTRDPVMAARKPKPYASYARGEDYYREGALVWLEADQVIRQGTAGARGLDDFARAFFARSSAHPNLFTYERGDVIAGLNAIYPHDWDAFFRERIDAAGRPAPLRGIELAGYKLVWKSQPNPYEAARMDKQRELDLSYSLGLTVDGDGDVSDPVWDSPAFRAGIVTGSRIVAVDTIGFTMEGMRQALERARQDKRPIQLLVQRGNRFTTVPVSYFEGLRWPWLEPATPGRETALDRLLAPRTN